MVVDDGERENTMVDLVLYHVRWIIANAIFCDPNPTILESYSLCIVPLRETFDNPRFRMMTITVLR